MNINRSFGIHRIYRGHRLYADRVIASHGNVSNLHFTGFSSAVVGQAVAIVLNLSDLRIH